MKKLFDYGTLAVLLLSVALNIGLAFKVRSLTRPGITTATLQTGTQIRSMTAEDLSGQPTQIEFAAAPRPTVLYVFSPTCRWCAKNLDNIKKLYANGHGNYRFVGVSLAPEGIPEYLAESGFPMQTVKNPAQDAVKTLHLAGTPETIVIDSSGSVQQVWPGAFRPEVCRDIEAYFHLPAHTLTGI